MRIQKHVLTIKLKLKESKASEKNQITFFFSTKRTKKTNVLVT